MTNPTFLSLKLQSSLYGAYAPELGLGAYGSCQDEALNNLTDELRLHHAAKETANGLLEEEGERARQGSHVSG